MPIHKRDELECVQAKFKTPQAGIKTLRSFFCNDNAEAGMARDFFDAHLTEAGLFADSGPLFKGNAVFALIKDMF